MRTKNIQFASQEPQLAFSSGGMVESLKILIPLPEELLAQEKNRLNKELDRLTKSLDKLRQQMSNPEFVSKAPPQLIEKHQSLLSQTEKELEEVTSKLSKM